ncbi:uncharacterized protein ATNIH1004_004562 [Aspergillus tanneri]|uniref:Uncharacterized protein n=2 Tax=Aspergillus tanneri TaxID=1220188 RepID=A0A5M9N295_9EURO|nr:uncharacterized protein ATNIH1004_004562 [Aspergillus tanneri]KAA8648677.1 hypothetical protein ATNIH1004_004562 [Aspergillus tanneri]
MAAPSSHFSAPQYSYDFVLEYTGQYQRQPAPVPRRGPFFSGCSSPELGKVLLQDGLGVGAGFDAAKAEVSLQRGIVQIKHQLLQAKGGARQILKLVEDRLPLFWMVVEVRRVEAPIQIRNFQGDVCLPSP